MRHPAFETLSSIPSTPEHDVAHRANTDREYHRALIIVESDETALADAQKVLRSPVFRSWKHAHMDRDTIAKTAHAIARTSENAADFEANFRALTGYAGTLQTTAARCTNPGDAFNHTMLRKQGRPITLDGTVLQAIVIEDPAGKPLSV